MDGLRGERLAALLEHAYAPAASLDAWLGRLTESFAQLAPSSLGAVGRIVSCDSDEAPRLVCPYAVRTERGALARALELYQQVSAHRVDLVAGKSGLRDFRRTMNAAGDTAYTRALTARFESMGMRNLHHLTASDVAGHTVSVGLMSATRTRGAVPRLLWAVLNEHLESAFHLQVLMSQERARPRGKTLDGALQTLHTPRTARPLDLGHARTVWRGILDGSWAVLGTRDADDRCYLLAIPTGSDRRDRRALTGREARIAALATAGHSDKEIGYVLDLARSTVSEHLQGALRKLRVDSRVALAAAFRSSHDLTTVEPCGLRAYAYPGRATLLAFDLAPRVAATTPAAAMLARLPPAQARVARLAVQGLTDAEIAHHLGRARHTVANQLRVVYRRFAINSRAELAALIRPR